MTKWQINGVPHCALIDKNGTIKWRGHPASIDIEAEINKLLATEMKNNGIDSFVNLSVPEDQLKGILLKARQEFDADPNTFCTKTFQQNQLQIIDKLVEDRTVSMQARVDEARKQEEERIRKRKEAEEAKIAEMERQREQEQKKDQI